MSSLASFAAEIPAAAALVTVATARTVSRTGIVEKQMGGAGCLVGDGGERRDGR